jgi:hypothetical protein
MKKKPARLASANQALREGKRPAQGRGHVGGGSVRAEHGSKKAVRLVRVDVLDLAPVKPNTKANDGHRSKDQKCSDHGSSLQINKLMSNPQQAVAYLVSKQSDAAYGQYEQSDGASKHKAHGVGDRDEGAHSSLRELGWLDRAQLRQLRRALGPNQMRPDRAPVIRAQMPDAHNRRYLAN